MRERPGAGLRLVTLLEDPMHVALPAEHPLVGKRALTIEDLRDQQWVQTSASSACARHVVRSCLAAGFEPYVAFESDDYDTIQGLVAAGVGVALIPRLALTRIHPGIVVRALSPSSPARKVTVATPSGPGLSPAARMMITVLRDVARRYLDSSPPDLSVSAALSRGPRPLGPVRRPDGPSRSGGSRAPAVWREMPTGPGSTANVYRARVRSGPSASSSQPPSMPSRSSEDSSVQLTRCGGA